MTFDGLPKQCFTLVEHGHFLARIPLYDLMSQPFHISIQALSLFWTLFFTRLAAEWVIYVQPELVAYCWGTHMKQCRYWNCFILSNTNINVNSSEFPYLDVFPPCPRMVHFPGQPETKEKFLPHVTPQYSSTESHLEQMEKTIATVPRLNFLNQGRILWFGIVRNARYNPLGV